MTKRRLLVAVAVLVVGAAAFFMLRSDGPTTYEVNGRTWEVDCDNLDQFADQWIRYGETEEESQVVFTAWHEECGDDWVEEAFDRILYGPDGEG